MRQAWQAKSVSTIGSRSKIQPASRAERSKNAQRDHGKPIMQRLSFPFHARLSSTMGMLLLLQISLYISRYFVPVSPPPFVQGLQQAKGRRANEKYGKFHHLP